MALSKKELDQLVEHHTRHDPFRTWRQRDDELHFRSLYVKHEYQLDDLITMYQRKFERIKQAYLGIAQGRSSVPHSDIEEALKAYEEKLIRMAVKARDVDLEVRGRVLDNLKRNPIGTEYFIDLDGGNNANTGLSPAQAWLTLQQYCATSVRSPGDIAWVRAGTSQVPVADIVCDEDGTRLQPIYIIGCDGGSVSGSEDTDPWGDDDDTRPEIDFNGGAYTFYIDSDYGWYLKRLNINSSNDTAFDSGNISIISGFGDVLESCIIQDRNGAGMPGARVRTGHGKFIDCDFQGNRINGLLSDIAMVWCYKCRFNGGAETQDYGFNCNGGNGYFEECDFGQTSAHDNGDVGAAGPAAVAVFKACRFNDLTAAGQMPKMFFEDCSGGPVANGAQSGEDYRIEKVDDPLPGGESGESASESGVLQPSGYSLKVTPLRSSFVGFGSDWSSVLLAPHFYGPLRLWLAEGTYSVKVKIRSQAAWATYPTNEELYLKATYYDEENTFSVAEAFSDEVLSDATTWVDFEVQFRVGREGPVYLDVILDKYEAGPDGIYIYPFPEVTAL